MHGVRSREVRQVARGQAGGVSGVSAHAGSASWAREVRLVGWTVGSR
jgi:hypothetical protein